MDKSIVNPLVPYAYENLMREALLLRERYPELIQLGSIGKSSEGRAACAAGGGATWPGIYFVRPAHAYV